jgi:hypothetical protein
MEAWGNNVPALKQKANPTRVCTFCFSEKILSRSHINGKNKYWRAEVPIIDIIAIYDIIYSRKVASFS